MGCATVVRPWCLQHDSLGHGGWAILAKPHDRHWLAVLSVLCWNVLGTALVQDLVWCTVPTLYCTLHCTYPVLYPAPYLPCTVPCTVPTLYCILHRTYSVLYYAPYLPCTVPCTVPTLRCTLHQGRVWGSAAYSTRYSVGYSAAYGAAQSVVAVCRSTVDYSSQ